MRDGNIQSGRSVGSRSNLSAIPKNNLAVRFVGVDTVSKRRVYVADSYYDANKFIESLKYWCLYQRNGDSTWRVEL